MDRLLSALSGNSGTGDETRIFATSSKYAYPMEASQLIRRLACADRLTEYD